MSIFLARQVDIYAYTSASRPNGAYSYGHRYNPQQSNLAANLTSTKVGRWDFLRAK
jgi:hypothetical protein